MPEGAAALISRRHEAKAVAEIRDRAVAAGYDLTPCTDLPEDEAGCLDEITVSADGAGLFINLYGSGAPVAAEGAEQRYGVLHPGYDILFVDANSTPEGLRSSIEALRDSAKEKSAIEQGRAVYVVIDNRVWSVAGGGPVLDEQKFLDLVGRFEGCAPDCSFQESSFER